MSIWKIVSGILSIVLCFFVIFQSCAAGIVNAITQNGDISGSAGLIVAILLLVGGIVSIATRDAIGNGGNIALIVIFGLAVIVGYTMAGIYSDLVIWSTWCLLCAVIAAMAIAADNVCSAWVYILIAIVGIVIAVFGFGLNMSENREDAKPSNDSKKVASTDGSQKQEGPEELQVLPEEKGEGNSSDSGNDTMIGSGDLGDYHVEIKEAELGKSYSDEPIIVVTYAWTNNSEETKSAMYTVSEQAFQDGIELESAYSAEGVDFSDNSKDVRPGNTLDIKKAFILTSDSTVEFEITEWISFSDDMVSMNFEPQDLK